MRRMVDASKRVGAQGTPIVANYWVNRGASRDSQTVDVADGKIRVIEVGSFTCGPCISAVPGLNRLSARYADVEFIFLTWTLGWWGNRAIDPRVESEKLAAHFLENVGAKIPIGIAFRPRETTDEGLSIPRIATNTLEANHYPEASKPTFYILDGTGRIRRVIFGYSRDLEDNMAQIIEFLRRDARRTTYATP
jgi:thiol-disulfide isomerase/thioredoxin